MIGMSLEAVSMLVVCIVASIISCSIGMIAYLFSL